MATDPGDLVLDPTCGSGTTATVAEQWGRRWITIDTSRVALALARARIMGARYPFYLLADSREGQLKEAEVTRSAPSTQPVHGNIRHGFVYERVPHITLKSIANNAEIDVIWDQWQAKLEPLREALNAALKKPGRNGRSPREADAGWPDTAKKLHADWWQARIAGRRRSTPRSPPRPSSSTSTTSPTRTRSASASPAPSPSRASPAPHARRRRGRRTDRRFPGAPRRVQRQSSPSRR
jgi:adenine-specific DNA-methyltransferase